MTGIPNRPTPAQRAAIRRGQVYDLYKQGVRSQKQIAQILGVAPSSISDDWKKLGLEQPNARTNVAKRRERIKKMAKEGYTTTQIAREMGMDRKVVSAYTSSAGIDIPADKIVHRHRHVQPTSFVEKFVENLTNRVATLSIVEADVDEVDPEVARQAAFAIKQVVNTLNVFRTLLTKRATSQPADGNTEATT